MAREKKERRAEEGDMPGVEPSMVQLFKKEGSLENKVLSAKAEGCSLESPPSFSDRIL